MIKYIVLIGILLIGSLLFVNKDKIFSQNSENMATVSNVDSQSVPQKKSPARCTGLGSTGQYLCVSCPRLGYSIYGSDYTPAMCNLGDDTGTTTIQATTTKYFSLSVKKQGATKSTISPQDSRTVQYPAYTQIILKANPYAGDSMSTMESKLTGTRANKEYFVGWSGDCSGRGSCSVMMNKNREVTAKFEKR